MLEKYVKMTYNDGGLFLKIEVDITRIRKDLKKLPDYVIRKLQKWADQVVLCGMEEVRKSPGYHDEPLKGKRKGLRSVRLSKGYRAIYGQERKKSDLIIIVWEVNKHEY